MTAEDIKINTHIKTNRMVAGTRVLLFVAQCDTVRACAAVVYLHACASPSSVQLQLSKSKDQALSFLLSST